MANSETNKAAIEKNRRTIFEIEAQVMSNKALAYQS